MKYHINKHWINTQPFWQMGQGTFSQLIPEDAIRLWMQTQITMIHVQHWPTTTSTGVNSPFLEWHQNKKKLFLFAQQALLAVGSYSLKLLLSNLVVDGLGVTFFRRDWGEPFLAAPLAQWQPESTCSWPPSKSLISALSAPFWSLDS